MNTSSKFLIEVSEEYEIVGEVDQKSEVARLYFKEVDQEIIATLEIGKSEFLLELIALVSEFKQSIQMSGVNIKSIVKRFTIFTNYKDFLEKYGFPAVDNTPQ